MNKVVWFVGAGLAALQGVAGAQITYVNPDGGFNQDERCLVGVNGLCQGGAYDGAVSIIGAIGMDLDTSLVRVDDGLDRIWEVIGNPPAQPGRLVGRARYAAHDLRLGYDTGAGFVSLVNNIPTNQIRISSGNLDMFDDQASYPDSFAALGSWQPVNLTPGTLFAFVLSDLTASQRWTSNNGGSGVGSTGYNNSGNLQDHMVTFQVSSTHYVIAWEDLPFSGSDFDYNDMVVEVRWLSPVPLPAGLPLLLSGLAGFAALARGKGVRSFLRRF